MNIKTIRWFLSGGLVATGLSGCADPCTDDGLIQSSISECPVAPGIGASDTEGESEDSMGETETASDSNSDTLETDSAGGGDCMDGDQNGDETDVDCGGSCDEQCDDGEGCMEDGDCMSGECGDDDTCESTDTDSEPDPECDDGEQNGNETDVDCGNRCGATCEDGEGCDDDGDCVSGVCDTDAMTCAAPECDDGQQNGDETDEDCGNTCGATCEDGEGCDSDDDCISGVCDEDAETCVPAECDDGVQNGSETDVDCGNRCGATCEDGETCDDGADCISGVCDEDSLTCVAPECDDGVQNGDETDVDCGNSCGATCEDDEVCDDAADCISGVCDEDMLTCAPPACDDGVQNGDETDLDCGNTCGATCEDGEMCDSDGDCISNVCNEMEGTCTPGSCDDDVQNGDEEGIDCGGSCSANCDPITYCDDVDDDGFGDPDSCVTLLPHLDQPPGTVTNADDCDDTNPNAFPGAAENEPELCAEDEDDDGWGDSDPPPGVDPGSDCVDTNADIFPGAAASEPDLCTIDEDEDGYGSDDPPAGAEPGSDCVDTNPDVFPGAAELEPDVCAIDEDDDGYGDADPPDGVEPGTDCVDTNADIFPGAAEFEPDLCTIDDDGDGYGSDTATDIDPNADNGTDCADDNPDAFPGAAPNDSPTACMEDEDGDDYGDADPPAGVDPGTDCNDNDTTVPFVVDGIPNDCATAELLDGSLGCEFYAIPLSNLNTPTYSLLLANANPSLTATATVEQFVGGVWATVAGPISLAPETQATQVLPYTPSGTTEIRPGGSYRVLSDIPIAAYQASVAQFTSDASLLIPRASWDLEYDVVGYDGSFGEEYIAITAAEDGTDITVVPSRDTIGGAGIPATAAGGTISITLDEGDTAVIMSAAQNQTVAEGLSGSIITSTAPIGVFTGTECSNIPTGETFCDHLEEMQTPTNTASSSVVASRMPPRDQGVEDAVWQIYAVEDTTVSFDALPGVTGLPAAPVALLAGESLELSVGGTVAEPGDFVVDADAPIIVSQYLTGSTTVPNVIPGSGTGDPAHVIMPGASQLLEAYVVGTVPGNVINHLTVTRQVGSAGIALDGANIAGVSFSPISADWEVARIEVTEGSHVLTSEDAFSVVVSGYNSFNSYAYLGGGQARALICE